MLPILPLALSLASQFAPAMLQYLTGSEAAGAVAGKVVDIASLVTGGAADPVAALKADPALSLQFQQKVMENETAIEAMHLAGVQGARDRDVDLAKLGRRNVRADLMVLLDVVGLISCLVVLCFFREKIPGEAIGLISTIAATFGLCLRDAHQFEFGSSRSSQAKDATINNLTK